MDRSTHQKGVDRDEEAGPNGSMIYTRTDPGSAQLLRHDTRGKDSNRPAQVETCGPLRARA